MNHLLRWSPLLWILMFFATLGVALVGAALGRHLERFNHDRLLPEFQHLIFLLVVPAFVGCRLTLVAGERLRRRLNSNVMRVEQPGLRAFSR